MTWLEKNPVEAKNSMRGESISLAEKDVYDKLAKEAIDKLATWKWKLTSTTPLVYFRYRDIWTVRYPWFRFSVSEQARQDYVYGLEYPKRFGLAYKDFDTDITHYYIIPINLIVACARRVYFAIKWEIPNAFRSYEARWRRDNGK